MTRSRIVLSALPVCLVLAACGEDAAPPRADSTPAPVATTTAASGDRYCALVRELDAAGEAHFASLGRDATPEEYEAAERSFVEANAARLDDIAAAAPPAIDADVDVLLAAQRGRAGIDAAQAPSQKAASAAERRIKRFEKANC